VIYCIMHVIWNALKVFVPIDTYLFICYKNRTQSTNIKDDIKHKTSHISHIRKYKYSQWHW